MRLGIFGGTFNPVHNGHLAIATRVAEALRLGRIFFVPTAVTPLKGRKDLASARDRLAMLRAAVKGHPIFRVSDVEIRRGGVSYTVDTLRQIKGRMGGRLYLILGTDALNLLPRWRDASEVLRLAELVVVERQGHRTRLRMPKIYKVDAPLMEISGTEIRERVRKGLSIRYLVPEAVERYIRRKGLYRLC